MSSEESSTSNVELQLKVADLEAEMNRLQRRLVSVQQKVKVEHRQDQHEHAPSKLYLPHSNKNTREEPPHHPQTRTTRTKKTPTTTKVRKTDPVSSRSAAPPVKKRTTSLKNKDNPQPPKGGGLRVVRRPNKSRQASIGPKVLLQLQSSTRQSQQLKRTTTTTKNRSSLLSAIRQRFFWKTTMNINLTRRVQAIEQQPPLIVRKSKSSSNVPTTTTAKLTTRPKPKTLAPSSAPTKRRPDVVVVPPRITRTIPQPTDAPPAPPRQGRPQMLKRLQGNLRLDVPKSPKTSTTLQKQNNNKQRPRPLARHDTPALACLSAAQSKFKSKSNATVVGRDPPPQIIQVARQPIPPVVVVGASEQRPSTISPSYVLPSGAEPVHNNSKTKGIWRKPKATAVQQPKEPPATWKKPKATPNKTTTRSPPRLQTTALLADIRKPPKLTSTSTSTPAKIGTPVHETNTRLSTTTKQQEPPLGRGGQMSMVDILQAAPKLKPTKTKVGNVVTSSSSSVHRKANDSMFVVSTKKEEPPSLGCVRSRHASDDIVSTMTDTSIRNAPNKLNSVRRTKVVGSAETSREPPSGDGRSNNDVNNNMVSMLKNRGNTHSSPHFRGDPPPQRKPDPPAKEISRIHVQSFVQGADKPATDCPTEITTTSQPRGRVDFSQQQQQSSIVKKWNRFASMETKGICAAPRLQTKVVQHQNKDAADHKTTNGRPAPPQAKPAPQPPRTEIPARSNLLAQIRQKDAQLKPVDHHVDTPSRSNDSAPPVVDLFAGIRAGVALKKVEEADKGPAQEKVSHGSALLAKLQARKAQITSQQQGHQFKPAVVVPVAKPCRTNATSPPAVDLFAGIRAGVALKKVQETEKTVNKASNTQEKKVTHGSALLAKLQARKKECMKRSGSGTPIEDDW